MGRISDLVQSYGEFIKIPWRDDAAAAERVIFCVYNERDERNLRAKVEEFELITRSSEHGWILYDVTDTFAEWLSSQRYAEKYFQRPEALSPLLPKYLDYIDKTFKAFLVGLDADSNTVVAVKGVGSLFGLCKVKDLVDRLAPQVAGRLLVFFPGNYEGNNYRLLNAYDGWNYLAVPITADKQF